MKFTSNKKSEIILYILEKISNNSKTLVYDTCASFNINKTTVYGYLNALIDDGKIKRNGRGSYSLITKNYLYNLSRRDGDLDSDTKAFTNFMKKHISHLPANIQEIWEYSFSEMINNVMDHSECEMAIVYIRQSFLKTDVYIIDDGIGIFKKIKDYFDLPSLDDAICELFKGKLTTDSENHSGEGIFFTSKIMDEFLIVSEEKFFAINKYDNDMIISTLSEAPEAPGTGTGVFMSLSNTTHKSVREVFDAFSDVDGGFKKTIIPIKNVYDTSPISRSQARRICNRLSRFEEVILDFKDVEWMGQGFAHQIFVVFSRANPDIKITPVNMNEAVLKMYKHVGYDK